MKLAELGALQWLCGVICKHDASRTVLECFLTTIHLVLDADILNMDVLRALHNRLPSILFEQYCACVVLVQHGGVNFETLNLQKILRLRHIH